MTKFKTTSVEEMRNLLHTGIVNFEFIKKDGSVRQAKGTLLAEHLPAPKADSKPHKKNDNVVVYFDLDKNEFRSFVKESFVGAY